MIKISVSDGQLLPICNVSTATNRGASWGADGTIVFSQTGRGLMHVPASGGRVEMVASQATDGLVTRNGYWPQTFPNLNDIVFANLNRGSFDDASIAVVSLHTGRIRNLHLKVRILHTRGQGIYSLQGPRRVWAVSFDSKYAEIRGEPVRVVQGVIASATTGAGHYSISSDGSLIYVAGTPSRGNLVSVDRQGKSTALPFPPGIYADARLSPSGDRLAVTIDGQDVWSSEIEWNQWRIRDR